MNTSVLSAVPKRQSETRNNLCASTVDGCAYSVMMGAGEANIVVFALAVGVNEVWGGLLGSLPVLGGALLHTYSPTMVRRLGSHKRWLLLCAFAQGASFIPMMIGAMMGVMPLWLIAVVAVVYWASCFSAGSTWNTYISTTVPRRVRTKYFSLRSGMLNLFIVVSTILAGLALERGKLAGFRLETFAGLFLIAAIARWVSWYFTIRQTEPVPIPEGFREVPLGELVTRYRSGPGGRLIAYVIAMQLALQISSPFLNPYFLKQIGLESDYASFGLLTATVLLAKVVSVRFWGRLAHSHGPRALLRIGGVSLVLLPLLYLVSTSLSWLLVAQALSGVALAAYELGVFLMLLESLPNNERTSVMCRYQATSQFAGVIGAGLGALTLKFGGHDAAAYALVFVLSALARAAALPLLRRIQPLPAISGQGVASLVPEPVLELHSPGTAADEPVFASLPEAESRPTTHDRR